MRKRSVRTQKCVAAGILAIAVGITAFVACTHDPALSAKPPEQKPRTVQVEGPTRMVLATPYRAKLTPGAELYVPGWFSPTKGGYDLIVHFHGLGKLQEANIEKAELNVAVVSINLGVGTDPYENAFKNPAVFQKLLADVQEEIDKSGRGHGSHLHRLALSAWSAGFV